MSETTVRVSVEKVPSPAGTGMVRVSATWPPGWAEWLVSMSGEHFHDAAHIAREPRWAWTGFLAAGTYRLHVEGHDPVPFEVTP